MPDATAQPNDDFLSKIVVQGGMVRVDTNGKSGAELARLQVIQEERKKDAENLVREFLEQVSFDPYYKATLTAWYDDTDGTLAQKYPDQPGLAERIRKVLQGDTSDIVIAIKTRIAQIDELIQMQLDQVLHDADFQKLEASWRGLHYLVDKSETGTHLKIRLLNASKADIVKDIESAVEFDQSALFKQIYEAEYGTYGGNPFSVLIGDYDFGRDPQDISTLTGISGVAAAAPRPIHRRRQPRAF